MATPIPPLLTPAQLALLQQRPQESGAAVDQNQRPDPRTAQALTPPPADSGRGRFLDISV